jgi:hypothetical protein
MGNVEADDEPRDDLKVEFILKAKERLLGTIRRVGHSRDSVLQDLAGVLFRQVHESKLVASLGDVYRDDSTRRCREDFAQEPSIFEVAREKYLSREVRPTRSPVAEVVA